VKPVKLSQATQVMDEASEVTACSRCQGPVESTYLYCPRCGAALGQNGNSSLEGGPVRRRLGGTIWRPVATAAPPPIAEAEVLPSSSSGTAAVRRVRKRRRRQRRWYQRRWVVIPLTSLFVVMAVLGAVLYRAEATLSTLRTVSTPPPQVTDNTISDEPEAAGLVVDTRPAQRALQEIHGQQGETAPSDGGLLGRLQRAAENASDLAEGAAVAAGVTDASEEAMTILVMGVDARPGAPIDIAVRPDALMVVRLDPVAGTCRVLAIPRDTLTELPGYGRTKINHALMVGGIPYQKLVVEQLLGVKLDRYALIDFTGFAKLVDAVGGVPVTVPQDIIRDSEVLFRAGPQTFTGEQALAYARYRGGADVDVGRVRRQQQLIRGLVTVARQRNLARDINDLLPAIERHIRTDLTTSELVALASTYQSRCTEAAIFVDSLQGDFVSLDQPDPIFKQPLTYNVVDQAIIQEKVRALLGRS
jgi:LCP family protein required for cell wall assembly